MNKKRFVVAGIGTGIGKTIVSAVLTEALQADYWKPVQSGSLEHTDTDEVRALISNDRSFLHPEAYRLTQPLSPHAAAERDEVEIETSNLTLPSTSNHLIIELAGGLMVPLNHSALNIDLLSLWRLPVILVSQNYLGSINHTLLSVELLRNRNIPFAGFIFNGESTPASEEFILQYTGINCIARIPRLNQINQTTIRSLARQINLRL
jgi:dethiobiotin synthetase